MPRRTALDVLPLIDRHCIHYCRVEFRVQANAESKLVHLHMIKSSSRLDVFLGTKLLMMKVKCGSLEDGRQVFDKMRQQNLVQLILRLHSKSKLYSDSDFFSVRFSIPIPTYSLEDFSFLYFIIFIILHYISDYNSAPALDLRLIDFGANLHSLFRYHFCSCLGQSATSHFDLATLSCCLQAVVGQHVSL